MNEHGAGRVLIVDDDEALTAIYAAWLEDYYPVETATSGQAALDALDADVAVILLDRRMPGLPGEAVLQSVREEGYDCRVAIVADEEPARDVVEEGFDALVVGPVSAAELTATVDRLLARASYESQLDELYQLCVKRAKARADGGVDGPVSAGLAAPGAGDDCAGDATSGDVAEIEAPIREVRESVDETVSSFETTDYRASFRDLPAAE